jgi:hypothetical protein
MKDNGQGEWNGSLQHGARTQVTNSQILQEMFSLRASPVWKKYSDEIVLEYGSRAWHVRYNDDVLTTYP